MPCHLSHRFAQARPISYEAPASSIDVGKTVGRRWATARSTIRFRHAWLIGSSRTISACACSRAIEAKAFSHSGEGASTRNTCGLG
jgi:hypothetical protein